MNIYSHHCYSSEIVNIVSNEDTLKNKWEVSDFAGTAIYPVHKNSIFQTEEHNYSSSGGRQAYISAAVEIYENGAKFCNMLLQHIDGVWKPWVNTNTCHVFCKNGKHGQYCEQDQPTNVCDDSDINNVFDKQLGNSASNRSITTFGVNSWGIIPLAIVDKKEHAIQVRAIWLGTTSGSPSDISEAYYHGSTHWLCAEGYEGQDGNCKRTASCKSLCPAGQGYPDMYHKTCQTCGDGTRRFGTDYDGVCHECPKGQIFNNNNCQEAEKVSAEKMRNCYKNTNIFDFKDCAKK